MSSTAATAAPPARRGWHNSGWVSYGIERVHDSPDYTYMFSSTHRAVAVDNLLGFLSYLFSSQAPHNHFTEKTQGRLAQLVGEAEVRRRVEPEVRHSAVTSGNR